MGIIVVTFSSCDVPYGAHSHGLVGVEQELGATNNRHARFASFQCKTGLVEGYHTPRLDDSEL
jgi:hypothetical protein